MVVAVGASCQDFVEAEIDTVAVSRRHAAARRARCSRVILPDGTDLVPDPGGVTVW